MVLWGTYSDGQVIAASQFDDLTHAAERRAHDNGFVVELLVVLEDPLNRGDTGVLLPCVLFVIVAFKPVEDATDEWGYEVSVCFGGPNSLSE